MSYLIQGLFIALNIAMAWYHADLIKKNKPIKHGLWGGGYLVACVAVGLVFKDWVLVAILLLIRKLVFDLALNVFRGLPPFHVSLTTTSITDKLQRKIFGTNGGVVAVVCAVLIIGLNVLKIFL